MNHTNQNASSKILTFLLPKLLLLCLTTWFIVESTPFCMAVTEPHMEVKYSIRLDVEGQKLFVTAEFTDVQMDDFQIGFINSFIYSQYNGTDLAERISDLTVVPSSIKLSLKSNNDDFKIYSIKTGGNSTFTLFYTFNTAKVPYDVHFTELTSTSLHIPGLDFLIRVFESKQDIKSPSSGLDAFQQYSFTFENLPADWEIISTYHHPNAHSVVIEDLWGPEILLSAGKYRKVQIQSGDASIIVALDKGLKLDMQEYSKGIDEIFQHFYSIYNHIPESKILMVVNQDPRQFIGLSKSFGGQVKKQNIINGLGWGSGYDSETLKAKILGHLAHEGHHIWNSHGFELKEGWYWFQEGFTEYISEKTISSLGMTASDHLKKELAIRYAKYNQLSIKDSKNLLQTSLAKNPTREERDINYHKGMLVAFLMDNQLQNQGKSLEQFMGDIYQAYAIPGKPIGNKEIIDFIDAYLGDDTLTKKYVLGTESIPRSSLGFGWKYYWWSVERYLPPLAFPWNLLVALGVIFAGLTIVYVAMRLIGKRLRNRT